MSYSLFQTSQTGGQWYSDTSHFSIPYSYQKVCLRLTNPQVTFWKPSHHWKMLKHLSINITNCWLFFFVKRVQGQGPEHRESEKTLLYLQIIIILISYIIIYYYILIYIIIYYYILLYIIIYYYILLYIIIYYYILLYIIIYYYILLSNY